MKRIVVGLLLVLLAACSDTALTRQQTAGIKTIGVISAIGDQLTIKNIAGATAEGVPEDKGSIAELGLDQYVVDQIGAKLQDRYRVVPVAYNAAAFRQTPKEQELHASLVQGQPLGQVIRSMTELPAGMTAGTATGVDAYVVVLPSRALLKDGDHPLYGTNLVQLPGTSGPTYNLGVVYWIAVIDGHSLQPIGNVSTLSDRSVDASLWAPTVDALTAAQRQRIAEAWKKRIDLTLQQALQKLQLTR